jgi:hypothetical protein
MTPQVWSHKLEEILSDIGSCWVSRFEDRLKKGTVFEEKSDHCTCGYLHIDIRRDSRPEPSAQKLVHILPCLGLRP